MPADAIGATGRSTSDPSPSSTPPAETDKETDKRYLTISALSTTGYELFKNKLDDCVKVILKPGMSGANDRPRMAVV